MATSETENKICPCCAEEVDPLRAAAVSIVDGKIAYFCSSGCRETFLHRDMPPSDSGTIDEAVGERPEAGESENSFASATAASRSPGRAVITRSVKSPEFELSGSTPRRSPLWMHFIEMSLLLGALAVIALARYGGYPILTIFISTGASIALSLGIGIFRERRNGAVTIVNSLAYPVTSLMLLGSGYFDRSSLFFSACVATGILLIRSTGRILETAVRHHNGVLDVLTGVSPLLKSSDWRDNSKIALRLRKSAMFIEWARIPVGLASGGALYLGRNASIVDALMTAAVFIVVLEPRLLRMVTGDAHLKSAIFVRQLGGRIRDANAIGQLGEAKVALMDASYLLTGRDVRVVDWRQISGTNNEQILKGLYAAESSVANRFSRAIVAFCRESGVKSVESAKAELSEGKGISAVTAFGRLHCGSRMFMLENGISTGEGEEHAHSIEESGRRALFVALDHSLVAAFGIDEQIRPGVEAAVKRMSFMGIEPVMLTSAEREAAQAMGRRLGIDHVLPECSEDRFESLLNEYKTAHVAVIFMGQGSGFEENVRHAACSVAVGDDSDAVSLADVDMRKHTLSEFVSVMEWAIAARRSIRISLFLTLLLYGVGICFAAGWYSYLMVVILAGVATLIAFGNTLSGPWPAIQNISRTVVEIPGKLLQVFRLANRKKP